MNRPTIKALLPEERAYTYSQSSQIESQCGCIGHLRADFGDGTAFFSTWSDHRADLKTDEFREEIDRVINSMRDSIFKTREALRKYCWSHLEGSFGDDRNWGARVDTDKFSYLFRLNPNRGEYNIYCFCYRRDWLDQHLAATRRGIRFINPNYDELFRVPDGGSVVVEYKDGEKDIKTVRYIDDYHVEIGWDIYHICEYAEKLQRIGATVRPLVKEV